MPILYFDASALVKLLLDEPGSDLAAELWDTADAVVASRLAHAEVCAALAAAERHGDLTRAAATAALARWDELWSAVRAVELTRAVERGAGRLARTHALRGADAVHLASALAVAAGNVVLVGWDRRLAAAAEAAGLRVAPATL